MGKKRRRKTESRVVLNPTQYDAVESLLVRLVAKIVWYIGGVGSGKSYVLGVFLFLATRIPGSLTLLTAPVLDTVNNSTLPGVLEAWSMIGLVEGRDYVFGKPPPHWGVKPYQKLRSAKVITWRNGSYTLLDGSNNYNKHRGLELDAIAIDELGNLKPAAADMYVGRLRGKARKKKGLPSVMFGVGNPPEDPEVIEQWREKPGVIIYEAPTHENARNLPTDYIDTMAATYDALTFDREVLGKLVAVGGLLACSSYTPLPFPAGNYTDRGIDKTSPLYLTCDFNASTDRPMSWILEQEQLINGVKISIAVKEFVNLGTSTRIQCQIVHDYLIKVGFIGELHVRGDATGNDSARNSTTAESDYLEIESWFRSGPWKWKKHRTRRTRRVKNRMAALNSRLRTRDGTIRLLINPKECPKTDAAAKRLRWASNQYELEENNHKDPIDAWSYRSYRDFPVHIKKAGKVKRR